MSTPIKNDRKAVYIGRRLWGERGDKVAHCFQLLPERRQMAFKGIKKVYIGYTYECAESTMPTRPTRTEDARIDNPEWEAADALVDARNARKRADAKIKANSRPAMKKAIEALKPVLIGLDYFQRRSLIEYLANISLRKK